MAFREFVGAVAALGASILAGGALAQASSQEVWPSYAPRCQTAELAADPALRDPCEQQLAVFGPQGPMVLSRGQGVDVEATGSIEGQRDRDNARSRL